MPIPVFHVDAFTATPFKGNPAAVCPLDCWLDDAILVSVAAENNLSETAFFVPRGDHYELLVHPAMRSETVRPRNVGLGGHHHEFDCSNIQFGSL
jgi:PhzF family phenazine biosynthesis protein